MTRTVGVVVSTMSFVFLALCWCFVVPDTQIILLNTAFNFLSWDWQSISRISEHSSNTAQFRMQFAVFLVLVLSSFFAILLTSIHLPKATSPKKGDGKTALRALILVLFSWLMLFVFPGFYVGGESLGVSVKSAFVAVPLLFCIAISLAMSLAFLLTFVVDGIKSFF
jgi:hypothetical protein